MTDLQIDYAYDGKLKRAGERRFQDDSHPYVSGVASIAKGKRNLSVHAESYYCRDELLMGIGVVMQHFDKYNTAATLENSRGDTFEFADVYGGRDADIAKYIEVLRVAMMGETNESFGFGASPYLTRYAVGKARSYMNMSQKKKDAIKELDGHSTLAEIRKTLAWRDWFYRLMIEADKEGIGLQRDMKTAWGLRNPISYGHRGLDQLKMQAQSRIDTNRDYVSWFPPIQLREVA